MVDRLFVVIFPAATDVQSVEMSLLRYLHTDGPSVIDNDGSVFLKRISREPFLRAD